MLARGHVIPEICETRLASSGVARSRDVRDPPAHQKKRTRRNAGACQYRAIGFLGVLEPEAVSHHSPGLRRQRFHLIFQLVARPLQFDPFGAFFGLHNGLDGVDPVG